MLKLICKSKSYTITDNKINAIKAKIKDKHKKELYIQANDLANRAVKIEFKLDHVPTKNEMSMSMLNFKNYIFNELLNMLIKKGK